MRSNILVATFPHVDGLLRAVRQARREMLRVYDVFTPFPVHGLDEAMGIRHTRLPKVTLIAGLTGLAFALSLQFYANVLDWPLNVGGKPDNTTLAFIPISFELTVLVGGLTTVAAFLLRTKLYPGKQPWLPAAGITDDVFALVLRKPSADETHQRALALLKDCGAASVTETEADL
jgi:ActD protein